MKQQDRSPDQPLSISEFLALQRQFLDACDNGEIASTDLGEFLTANERFYDEWIAYVYEWMLIYTEEIAELDENRPDRQELIDWFFSEFDRFFSIGRDAKLVDADFGRLGLHKWIDLYIVWHQKLIRTCVETLPKLDPLNTHRYRRLARIAFIFLTFERLDKERAGRERYKYQQSDFDGVMDGMNYDLFVRYYEQCKVDTASGPEPV